MEKEDTSERYTTANTGPFQGLSYLMIVYI